MFIFTFVKSPNPQHTSSWTVTSHIHCHIHTHTHTNTKTHKLLLQLCRAEQILQMNYWLCNSYSFVSLSMFTFSTIHWSCSQHNALTFPYHFVFWLAVPRSFPQQKSLRKSMNKWNRNWEVLPCWSESCCKSCKLSNLTGRYCSEYLCCSQAMLNFKFCGHQN